MHRAALLIPPLVAFGVFAVTIGGPFLSDDFLVNTMLEHGDEPSVNWGEIFADFTRSWAGLEGSYLYRPLVSLSWAITYSLGGMHPLPFHLFNVLLHTLATFAVALLCARATPAHSSRAALLGGLAFALHPIAAEPVAWIASRTTGLQVLFAAAALASFAGHLRYGGRLVATTTCFVLSLLSKESAVLLPFSFVLLDVWIRGRAAPFRAWRVHAFLFGVLALYFLVRLLALGALIGNTAETLQIDPVAGFRDKLSILFAPVGNVYPEPWGYVFGGSVLLGCALLLLPTLKHRSSRVYAIGGLLWIALYFAPTYRLGVQAHNLGGSRMVYGATTIFALLVAGASLRAADRRLFLPGAALVVLGLGALSVGRVVQYASAYDSMRALRTSLTQTAERATVEHPIAFFAVTAPSFGIPFLNCNALYPLLEKPVADQDRPAVSLGFVTQPVPASEDLLFHTGPLRAIREQGAWQLDWHNWPPEKPVFAVSRTDPAAKAALPGLTRDAANATRFLAPGAIDPWQVESVEIEIEGACPGGRLEWLYTDPSNNIKLYTDRVPPPQFAAAPRYATLRHGATKDGKTTFHVDVSTHLTFLAAAWGTTLKGFQVTPQQGTVRRVVLHRRVAALPLPKRHRDAEVALSAPALVAPDLPAGATALRLYLMGPDTTSRMAVTAGGPVTITPELQKAIAIIMRSSRQKRWYYYFEAIGHQSHRTPVDWVRFRR